MIVEEVAMSQPAQRPARYEDLFDLPDNVVGEIVNGELHVSPRPASPHAFSSSSMGQHVGWRFQQGEGGPGGWWIIDEPELHLAADILVPDLAGWRKERMPVFPEVAYFELAPDWVCEILSPSTHRLDRIQKMPVYAREGVKHLWLVDPVERYLEVFRLVDGLWTRVSQHAGEGMIRAEPFDAVELDMGAWWPPRADEESG